MDKEKGGSKQRRVMKKNWLEWCVFAASLLLVVAMLSYIIYDGVTLGSRPPSLQVVLGEPLPHLGGYIIPVSVENTGDRSAEQVAIRVELENGGTVAEEATLDLHFVPRGAARKGWVRFTSDPRMAERVRGYAVSYIEP